MLASCAIGAADPAKILHLATNDIDTFDPQQWSDQYSADIGSAVFESLYEWDYLARPPGIVPVTAIAAPEISADGKTWTIRIKPGIYFTDDPAFRGKPRELTGVARFACIFAAILVRACCKSVVARSCSILASSARRLAVTVIGGRRYTGTPSTYLPVAIATIGV